MRSLQSEAIWALRNVRARGWRAVLAASLLAVALAANLLIFSTADSLVFHRVPYHEPERLVSVARQDPDWEREEIRFSLQRFWTNGGSRPMCFPACTDIWTRPFS